MAGLCHPPSSLLPTPGRRSGGQVLGRCAQSGCLLQTLPSGCTGAVLLGWVSHAPRCSVLSGGAHVGTLDLCQPSASDGLWLRCCLHLLVPHAASAAPGGVSLWLRFAPRPGLCWLLQTVRKCALPRFEKGWSLLFRCLIEFWPERQTALLIAQMSTTSRAGSLGLGLPHGCLEAVVTYPPTFKGREFAHNCQGVSQQSSRDPST